MPSIDDALVRSVAAEVATTAKHILGLRDRLAQLNARIYPQLIHADPCADRDLEKFLLYLCTASNDLHNMFSPLALFSERMTRFKLPDPDQAQTAALNQSYEQARAAGAQTAVPA